MLSLFSIWRDFHAEKYVRGTESRKYNVYGAGMYLQIWFRKEGGPALPPFLQ
jgi:hypothetical protein